MNYSFYPSAQEELDDAVEYYNKVEVGLGIEFVNEVIKPSNLFYHFRKRVLRYRKTQNDV